MPALQPDRRLRKVVTELAALGELDIEAILADLEASHRATVQALLDDFQPAQEHAPEAPTHQAQATLSLAGLSPWLAIRLEVATLADRDLAPALGKRTGLAFEMTQVALDALATTAAEAESMPFGAFPMSSNTNWFARTVALFLGRTATA